MGVEKETEILKLDYEISTEEGELKEVIVEALKGIFKKFDKDNDKVLNGTEFETFCLEVNGEKFDEETLKEIKDHFDCDNDGNLTERGFIEIFELQSQSDEEHTVKDLLKLGIDLDRLLKV